MPQLVDEAQAIASRDHPRREAGSGRHAAGEMRHGDRYEETPQCSVS